MGVTLRDGDGTILERRQFHGPVTDVGGGVVVLTLDDGTQAMLPADPEAFSPAMPGTYRLPCGDAVVNPDYLSVWDVAPGPDGT